MRHFELLCERVAESGYRPLTLVVDLHGLSLACFHPAAVWRLAQVLDVMQRRYSDGHGIPGSRIYVENAPGFFPECWGVVRPLLRAHLRDMVVVTAAGAHAALHERVDPAQLPSVLGGKALSANPQGRAFVTVL